MKLYGGYEVLGLEGAIERDRSVLLPLALEDANDIRRALAIGDGVLPELPKGQMTVPTDCVLARALSNGWKASIDGGVSKLTHPREGKTEEDVLKSVEALAELGFMDVSWSGPHDCTDCGQRDCTDCTVWIIVIPFTWPMYKLVEMFDRGRFPELVLNDPDPVI